MIEILLTEGDGTRHHTRRCGPWVQDLRVVAAAGGWDNVPDAGYRVAYALATDLLTAGHIVIADSVNPLPITRRSWLDAAAQAGAPAINVEIVCSDSAVHRSRVEERTSDLTGLVVPTWDEVQRREYEPWTAPVLRVDSARGVEQAVREVTTAIIAAVRCRGTR